jgi:glycosyltransferase involved in cell wall biosynthesis
MRLLYICSDFGIPPDGTKGPSIHLRSITRGLAEAGAEVLLLSPKDGPGGDHPAQRLLPPGCPPADQDAKLLKEWMTQRGYGDALAKELRPLLYNAWAPDQALRELRRRPVDVIVERLSLFGHVGLDLSQALEAPLVVEVNALLSEEARRFRSLLLVELAQRIERRVLEAAAAVLVVSAQLAEQLVAIGVERQKIHVVPNGADLEVFETQAARAECRSEWGLPAEAFVTAFVGSLKVWHGADVLVDAFAEFSSEDPNARLLIVGAGPTEAALREQAAALGLAERVVFTGAVPHERVARCLKAADVAVAPYRPMDDFYFSPIKLFEYMAAGVCVVASRLGQIEEVIEDEVQGLLCVPGDARDLCAKLVRLRRAPELRERLAAAAGRLVRERYTWRHAAEGVLNAVTQCLGAGAAP